MKIKDDNFFFNGNFIDLWRKEPCGIDQIEDLLFKLTGKFKNMVFVII